MKLSINLTDQEFAQLQCLANRSAQSIDDYVKSKILEDSSNLDALVVDTLTKINHLPSGTEFNIPQLFSFDWHKLDKGIRINLGRRIYQECKKTGANFKDNGKDSKNLQQYRKF